MKPAVVARQRLSVRDITQFEYCGILVNLEFHFSLNT